MIKKSIFGVLFFISFVVMLYEVKQVLTQSLDLFSLDLKNYLPYLTFSAVTLLAGLLFVIFVTFSQDWKLITAVLLLSNLGCFLFFPAPFSFLLALGFLSLYAFSYVVLDNKLKTYLTFQASTLLSPSVNSLARLFIVLVSVVYFLSTTAGFNPQTWQVPDSLVDMVSSFTNQAVTPNTAQSIPSTQLNLFKQNPELLRQFGINIDQLDNLTTPATNTGNVLRNSIKQQLKRVFNPYLGYLPLLLAFLFFISLSSVVSLLAILTPVVVWLIFWVLDKTGFTRFEKTTREVQKLVV